MSARLNEILTGTYNCCVATLIYSSLSNPYNMMANVVMNVVCVPEEMKIAVMRKSQ